MKLFFEFLFFQLTTLVMSIRVLFFFGLILVLNLVYPTAFAKPKSDSLFHQLNGVIENQKSYVRAKQERIDQYKSELLNSKDPFNTYLKIYDEYKSFIYDSAFTYARHLQRIAYQENDPARIAYSKIKLGFVLVSSGLFKETLDTLYTIRPVRLPDSVRTEFYYLMARTHYDLCDFDADNFYSVTYTSIGHAYIDSAMALLSSKSSQYLLMSGLKNVRQHNLKEAQADFEKMIRNFSLSDTDFAVAASTLSFIYHFSDEPDLSKEMLIRAAIADIRSCTKETLATLNLADILYKEGDVENAYTYVKIALDDANFYGARHRKVQVAAVFPIIEGQQLIVVESRRRMLFLYSSVITVLSLITIAFAIIIYKQFKNIGEAKRIISEANNALTDTNHQLSDANKIKEEYIWYYFNTTADYINKLDTLKKSMEMKLMTKKMEDLRFTVDSINIKKERDDLYHNFDKVFLKLFPDFVTVFNSFFKEEDKVHPKDDLLLNTELRIFALIRMGIHDNDKIAKILDYSVTTIYTYKTRIRSKSILENDDFDRQIMNIRAIG
jgi:predicted PurR-regulated permease PerM